MRNFHESQCRQFQEQRLFPASLSLPEHQVLKESRVSRSLVAHVVRLSLFSLRNEKDNIDKEWGLNPC